MQIGDVVQLKSGGPKMTVTAQSQYGGWICHWFFEAEGKFLHETFPEETLRDPR